MTERTPEDAMFNPAEEEAFAALIKIWKGVLSEVQKDYSLQAAASAMMLVALQAQEEHAGSERLAETLDGLATAIRSKRPPGGGSAAAH